MKYSDIKIRDRTYWENWINSFDGTRNIDNAHVDNALTRLVFNYITNTLNMLMVQQQDPTFKDNVIKTQTLPPSSMEEDDVYFQLIIPAYVDPV